MDEQEAKEMLVQLQKIREERENLWEERSSLLNVLNKGPFVGMLFVESGLLRQYIWRVTTLFPTEGKEVRLRGTVISQPDMSDTHFEVLDALDVGSFSFTLEGVRIRKERAGTLGIVLEGNLTDVLKFVTKFSLIMDHDSLRHLFGIVMNYLEFLTNLERLTKEA